MYKLIDNKLYELKEVDLDVDLEMARIQAQIVELQTKLQTFKDLKVIKAEEARVVAEALNPIEEVIK